MRFLPVSVLLAAGLCLMAQTPPNGPSTPGSITLPLQLSTPPTIPPERVVIQVGDVRITSAQIDQILRAYPENQRVWVNGPGRQAFIDQVVRVMVLAQEGKRRKLDQSEIYQTQLAFATAGILATHADIEIRNSLKPGDSALQAYYDLHKAEVTELRARHILIRVRGSSAPLLPGQADLSDEEALAKANEVRRKLTGGADFAELARTESSDEGTRNKGGELGFFKHGQMMPSFEEAAYALNVGDLSQPVKTPFGYHVIQVEENRVTRTPEAMRPDMEKAFANDLSKKFVEDLKAKTKVVVDPDFSSTPKAAIGPKP